MVGDFDEWQALYSSLMGFSPHPSKMHTRTGFFGDHGVGFEIHRGLRAKML